MVSAGCKHERGHIVDSRFFGAGYATETSRRIFCDVCRFQRWLDVEAALAWSQAEVGLIPPEAACAIAAAASVDRMDLELVRSEIARTGHSLVGLLAALQRACAADAGQYVHLGATTQDIEDTAQCLEMRDVLDELDRLLAPLVSDLAGLAETHRGDPALGRTHAQPALPMGFGLKAAGWVDEVLRDGERLEQVRARVLVAQLFGGVGTMAGFDGRGDRLIRAFAGRLGLTVPRVGWHTARDRVAEYVCALAVTAGTLGRIADELRTLSRPEFGEVGLPWRLGTVGSSTMPHKRNPEGCEQVVALARLAASEVGPALGAMAGDHERDGRALRLEWACVPDVSHYTLAAAATLAQVVTGLIVHRDRLSANVLAVRDDVCTERLMLLIAGQIGARSAHAWVYDRSQHARTRGLCFKEELLADGEVLRYLTKEQVDDVFEPAHYLGESERLVQGVVGEARQWLNERVAWKPA